MLVVQPAAQSAILEYIMCISYNNNCCMNIFLTKPTNKQTTKKSTLSLSSLFLLRYNVCRRGKKEEEKEEEKKQKQGIRWPNGEVLYSDSLLMQRILVGSTQTQCVF